MKVILLRDIKNVGRKYQVKEVNDGFARNGLIARGSALPATPENLGKMKAEMENVSKAAEIRADLLSKGLKSLSDVVITMTAKANPEGHLFAAINMKELADELEKKSGLKIDPAWIENKAIKSIGEHDILIKVDGKKSQFKLIVKS